MYVCKKKNNVPEKKKDKQKSVWRGGGADAHMKIWIDIKCT